MKEKKPFGIQRPRQTPDSTKQTRNTLPWKALEQQVVRLQKQIAQASQRGDTLAIHALQQHLIKSEAGRLLAVHRVAGENQGKDTAGVDGVKSLTLDEQLAMASTIHPSYWNVQPPLPVRRVWIPKSGADERRPLAILPMIDRCKQALVKLALEPEWEVRFDTHSYGFRPGRSTHDALAAILVALGHQPLFVFNADIEAAFDHLNQAVLLDKLQTYPALRRLINAWLTAGVLDGKMYSTSETGIAQGGVLSPLLMNIALHGMEAIVTEAPVNEQSREQPFLVRYADNFLILHADLNTLQQAIKRVKHWLAEMGLHLHPHKTRITHTLTSSQGQVGFDFLGFHIHQEPTGPMTRSEHEQASSSRSKVGPPSPLRRSVSQKVRTIIVPSQEASKRHRAAIEQKLQRLHMAPQIRVITELNPLIVGWSTYYTGIVDAPILHHYDDLMEQQLLKWASKRHPGKPQDWLLALYWHQGKNSRIFVTPDGKQLRRYQHTKILNGALF